MNNDSLTVQLAAAKALIEDPARWCQRSLARGIRGGMVGADCVDAVQWCAFGAVLNVVGDGTHNEHTDALQAAAKALFSVDFVTVNDVLGHEAVMKMYDQAIINSCCIKAQSEIDSEIPLSSSAPIKVASDQPERPFVRSMLPAHRSALPSSSTLAAGGSAGSPLLEETYA